MSRRFVLAMAVATAEKITVQAVDSDGGKVAEEWSFAAGEAGCVGSISGNFEDEPEIPDPLFLALLELRAAAEEVLQALAGIGADRQPEQETVEAGEINQRRSA